MAHVRIPCLSSGILSAQATLHQFKFVQYKDIIRDIGTCWLLQEHPQILISLGYNQRLKFKVYDLCLYPWKNL